VELATLFAHYDTLRHGYWSHLAA